MNLLPTRQLSGVSPMATLAVTAAGCMASLWTTRLPAPPPAAPLSGVLYAAASSTATEAAVPLSLTSAALPTLKIAVSAAARKHFPSGERFLAQIVATSTFTVTVAQAQPPRRKGAPKRAHIAPARTAPAVSSSTAAASPAAVPVAAQPATFVEYDQAVQASPTTQTINVRLKRSGVTFRATHAGRVGDRAVVRFAIANEEASDFFLSIVNVTADGSPIHSESAGPYVCRADQEIFGIVHFPAVKAAGKTIAIELVQSGGERRRFPLTLEYRW